MWKPSSAWGMGMIHGWLHAMEYIRDKQDEEGRWSLDYNYIGKTWVDFGEKKQPNKWVTYRAAWVLKNSN